MFYRGSPVSGIEYGNGFVEIGYVSAGQCYVQIGLIFCASKERQDIALLFSIVDSERYDGIFTRAAYVCSPVFTFTIF